MLLLPFLDGNKLYNEYRFDELWNGPHNQKLAARMPALYRCPSHGSGQSSTTSYVVVVGRHTAFPENRTVTYEDISDGPSQTILIVEVANSGIHWMEPRDLSFDRLAFAVNSDPANSISSLHKGGAVVVTANNRAAPFLRDTVSPETVRALLTIDGAERIAPF